MPGEELGAESVKTIFLRALEADDKAAALRTAISGNQQVLKRQRFEVDPLSFGAVPRSPFAYWVSSGLRELFAELPRFGSEDREAWMGLSTGSDTQWLRLTWEIPARHQGKFVSGSGGSWVPLSKGGEFAKFYAHLHLLVNWSCDGRHLNSWKSAELAMGRITANNSQCWNQTKYLRPGVTWTRRTSSPLSLRAMPSGCIFGDKGPALLVEGDDKDQLLAILAVTNSRAFRALVELQLAAADAAARSYEVGIIRNTPIPHTSPRQRSILATLARRAWLYV